MKCELFDHLNNVIRLDERQAKKIMRKILLAVQNLHENEIIHRDIKLVSLFSRIKWVSMAELFFRKMS